MSSMKRLTYPLSFPGCDLCWQKNALLTVPHCLSLAKVARCVMFHSNGTGKSVILVWGFWGSCEVAVMRVWLLIRILFPFSNSVLRRSLLYLFRWLCSAKLISNIFCARLSDRAPIILSL